jgi:hypothetical protein
LDLEIMRLLGLLVFFGVDVVSSLVDFLDSARLVVDFEDAFPRRVLDIELLACHRQVNSFEGHQVDELLSDVVGDDIVSASLLFVLLGLGDEL